MNHTKNIKLQFISKYLGIRTNRLKSKATTLGLKMYENSTLKKQDAIILLDYYLQSKKTSERTKEQAQYLLDHLDASPLKSVATLNSKGKQKSNRINKNEVPSRFQTWIDKRSDFFKVLYQPFRNFVQYIFREMVQSLASIYFKFLALLVAIMVQMHHSAHWFLRVAPVDSSSIYTSYGYAFMVDLFILVVTMEGKLSIARTFASLTFLSNVLYFQFWVEFQASPQAYTNAISSLLISGIMAYIIYAYTEIFVKYRKTTN